MAILMEPKGKRAKLCLVGRRRSSREGRPTRHREEG
jgi:hypothetical protein